MPYFTDYAKKEDEENPGQLQISGASPTTDSSGAISQRTVAGSGKGLVTGSGYQNLDKYIQNNQPQAFGQQVLGKVGSEVGAVQGNLGKIGEAKTQIASQNKTPEQAQLNAAIANPVAADAKAWQNWLNQQYQGPTAVSDVGAYNRLGSSTQKAQTSAGLLGNEAGRFSLLDTYFGRPNYNYGEKSLDNLLLQNAGVGRQSQGLQNQVTALKTAGKEAGIGLQNAITGTEQNVAQSRANARGLIGIDENGQVITGANAGAIGKQWSAVDQQIAEANAQRQAQQQEVLNNLQGHALTAAQLKQFGLQGGEQIYNVDPSQYFTKGSDLNKSQVMSANDLARIRALSQMAGVTDTYSPTELTAKTDPYGFNTAQFKNDIAAAKANYDRDWNTPVVTAGGPVPASMAQLRDFVANVAQAQANVGRNPNDPSTWQGSNAEIARSYINDLNAFKASHGLGNTLGRKV